MMFVRVDKVKDLRIVDGLPSLVFFGNCDDTETQCCQLCIHLHISQPWNTDFACAKDVLPSADCSIDARLSQSFYFIEAVMHMVAGWTHLSFRNTTKNQARDCHSLCMALKRASNHCFVLRSLLEGDMAESWLAACFDQQRREKSWFASWS